MSHRRTMTHPARISYGLMALTFVLVGWLHLATPLLAVLFSFFALSHLQVTARKWPAVAAFVLVLLGLSYGAAHFIRAAVVALPSIADSAIPTVIGWAEARGIELPFTDYQSLKVVALDTVKAQAQYVGTAANFARGATTEFVLLVMGIVIAVGLFFNSTLDLDRGRHALADNLYSRCCDEISERFRTLYESFAMVMGAQVVIAAINTALTAVFVLTLRLPHAAVILGVTFLCGLLPIVGNLISNLIIVCVAFMVSPRTALAALVFLILVHKLEYFLNSKIIGARIRTPVWLTLVGLIVGEHLLGLAGMILAPVVLHYLKVEGSRIDVPPRA